MNKVPMFPILDDPVIRALPWSLFAPHEKQARENHGQSLRQLASRGGLSVAEAYWILKDQRFPFGSKLNLNVVRVQLMCRAAEAAKQAEAASLASVEAPPAKPAAPQLSGDACRHCGNFALVRTGTCQTCQACGETSGCS